MNRHFAAAKQLLQEYGNDKVSLLSAAFSYGAIFSLGPLLLVLISIVSLIFGDQAAQGRLFSELSGTVGASTAHTIQNVVVHTRHSGNSMVALVIGAAGTLLGAAGLTSQLQNAFDTIFVVVPDPKGGLKRTLYVKGKNVLLVLLAAGLLAVSLAVSAIAIGLGAKVSQHTGLPIAGLEAINSLVSLAVFVVMLYLLYRTVPDVVIPRRIVWAAALGVALLFLLGKILLGIIIGRNSTASAYGAAAALVSLLLWIYYSGQILLIGAEAIKVYGDRHGLRYDAKKLNLQRTVLYVDADTPGNRLLAAWTRGFRRAAQNPQRPPKNRR